MHFDDLDYADEEIKPYSEEAMLWRAYSLGIFDHPVVGWHRKPPKPQDAKRHSQPYLLAWLWMVRKAAFADHKRTVQGQCILLRRGQLVGSQRFLGGMFNWTRKGVRIFLDRLVQHKMIRVHSTENYSQLAMEFPGRDGDWPKWGQPIDVITICNFDKYQNGKNGRGQPRANLGPSKGQARAQTNTRDTYNKDDRGGDEPSDDNIVQLDQHRAVQERQFVRYHALATAWCKAGNLTQVSLDRSFTDANLTSLVEIHSHYEPEIVARALDTVLTNIEAKQHGEAQSPSKRPTGGLGAFSNYFSKTMASTVANTALAEANLAAKARADAALQEESYKQRMSKVRNGGKGSSWTDLGNEVFGGVE